LFIGPSNPSDYGNRVTKLSQDERIQEIKKTGLWSKQIINGFFKLSGDYEQDLKLRIELNQGSRYPFIVYFGPDQKDQDWAIKQRKDLRNAFQDKANFYWIKNEIHLPSITPKAAHASNIRIRAERDRYLLEDVWTLEAMTRKILEENNFLTDDLVERIKED